MVLRSNVRAGDIAARYGGDEFVILLRKADAAASLAFVERIRTALSYSDNENDADAIPAFTLSTSSKTALRRNPGITLAACRT